MATENIVRLLTTGALPAQFTPLVFPMPVNALYEALLPIAEAADTEARRIALEISLEGGLEDAYDRAELDPAIVGQDIRGYVSNYPAAFLAAYVDIFDAHYRYGYRETFWEAFEELVKARLG
jgi:hypothetical protein